MCTAKELREELVRLNQGSCLVNIVGLMRLTGYGRTKAREIVEGLPRVGGPQTFFLGDVAEALIKRGFKG